MNADLGLTDEIKAYAREADCIAQVASGGYRFGHPLSTREEAYMYFLGAGGGDYVLRTPVLGGQVADVGGFGIRTPLGHIFIDPGPDSVRGLLRIGVDPRDFDAVAISHRHADHFADWEFVIARMTGKAPPMVEGTVAKHGCLLATQAFLNGTPSVPPVATEFYLSRLDRVETLIPGISAHRIGGVTVYARTAHHRESRDTDVVPSLDIVTEDHYVVYLADGEYREDIVEERLRQPYYRPPDVVVANIQTLTYAAKSADAFTPNHLGLRGTVEVLRQLKPRIAVVRSWGLETIVEQQGDLLIPAPTRIQCYQKYLQDATGVRVEVPGLMLLEIGRQTVDVRHIGPPVGS